MEVVTKHGVERVVDVDGIYYSVERADPKPSRRRDSIGGGGHSSPRHSTDFYESKQSAYAGHRYPREEIDTSRTPRPGHSRRRSSVSTPQRPSTTRPSSSHRSKPPPVAQPAEKPVRVATEADRAKHKIPQGYSMKNWDPEENPILLCGSVFDANSLGQWIYDWTVYHHGLAHPTSQMAGRLWVFMIQYTGGLTAAEDEYPRVRSRRNKEIVLEFIESGERLTGTLYGLLKRCEAPMLQSGKRKDPSTLGNNAGVEFVKTLFGPDRELKQTERFMKSADNYIKRFAASCQDIVTNPTM